MSAALPAPSTMVVVLLLTVTFLARPRSVSSTLSSWMPRSSKMACAPARVAMSSIMALRRSP